MNKPGTDLYTVHLGDKGKLDPGKEIRLKKQNGEKHKWQRLCEHPREAVDKPGIDLYTVHLDEKKDGTQEWQNP